MSSPKVIESGIVLGETELDHHFRVFAGPGAGKTHWLTQHIENVVRHSKRLRPPLRIVCISYTNVAANEIVGRLGPSADRVEVSTIHSFLYRNVVKPYLHLLKDDNGQALVNYELVDGHDEHRPTDGATIAWLEFIGKKRLKHQYFKNRDAWHDYVQKLTWCRDDDVATWRLRTIQPMQPPQFLPTSRLDWSYKRVYWNEGTIHHDDVLYFAYRILDEYRILRTLLSARFPYLFIDEFQDTSPVQTQVLKWLAQDGTMVGVVGDAQQSIYEFQGAKPEHFAQFSVTGEHVDYHIRDNRRSTNRIVKLLNRLRSDDIEQIGLRNEEGEPVRIYVGDIGKALAEATAALGGKGSLIVLTRKNEEVARIRRVSSSSKGDVWRKLEEKETTGPWRSRFLQRVVEAGELAIQGLYTLAVQKLLEAIRIRRGQLAEPFSSTPATEKDRRGIAVSLLEYVVNNHEGLYAGTLFDAYQNLRGVVSDSTGGVSLRKWLSGGKGALFAAQHLYGEFADAIALADDTRDVRNIHKAKSQEFDNVLVWLKEGETVSHLMGSEKESDEERRITYVALSRARNRLFVALPELSQQDEGRLAAQGLEVTRLC